MRLPADVVRLLVLCLGLAHVASEYKEMLANGALSADLVCVHVSFDDLLAPVVYIA